MRYFNAAGCDPDGEIGEKHQPEMRAIPNAIIAGLRGTPFKVNGNDYDTVDGTAVRDYVHVSDLARAHVVAGEMVLREVGARTFNLGTGTGTSVLQIVVTVETTGTPCPSGSVLGDRAILRPSSLGRQSSRPTRMDTEAFTDRSHRGDGTALD